MLRTKGNPELRAFDPTIRFLHWLTLFLVATIFVLAFSIDLASSNKGAAALIQLHRSFGLTVWIVTLGRLVSRQFSRFPNWPADMPQAMRFAAHWSEYALYVLLLAQPILGLLQTNAHGDRVDLFFLGELPALIGRDRPLAKQLLALHETVGFLFLGMIALHASAALYHHFWRHDDTLDAMLPWALRRRDAQDRAQEGRRPDHGWLDIIFRKIRQPGIDRPLSTLHFRPNSVVGDEGDQNALRK
jgi:cytochrome b561